MMKVDINMIPLMHTNKENIMTKLINRYTKINVDRTTREKIQLFVPLREKQIVFHGEGEIALSLTGNKITGNIIINVETENDPNYIQKDNDIHYSHEITLYEYLY